MSAPKLPDGVVILGKGRTFEASGLFAGWRFCAADGDTEWEHGEEWEGSDRFSLYAAPIDSEIARLNGHGAELPTAESEAVALVRKLAGLRDVVNLCRDELENKDEAESLVIAEAYKMLAEAEAFLAREDGK